MSRLLRVFALAGLGGLGTVMITCGCGGTGSPTSVERERVYSVSVHSLMRDRRVAETFLGSSVRARVEPDQYAVVGREIHVPGTVPGTPPVVVFRLAAAAVPPPERVCLTVSGRVERIDRDGIWRTTRADYTAYVADCVAVVTGSEP